MKIVASTKLTRAQRAMKDAGVYGKASNEVYDSAETKALEGDDKKTLYVVVSSDKGLCGGVHSGLSRYIRRTLGPGLPAADLAIIGEKARSQLTRTNGQDIVLNFAGIGKDVPSFADAQAIADQIVQLPTEYSDVKILYNKFINATSYEATIIPAFSEEAIAASPNFSAFEVEEEVIPNMREYSLANSLYWALAEGHACEISARRNAMDVGTPTNLYKCFRTNMIPERFQERRRDDHQVPDSLQPNTSSRHYRRVGRDHHWCHCFGGHVK
jgi:F-type H+-transporting ATPase subunit gamma